MQQHAMLTAQCSDQKSIVCELTRLASSTQCNIATNRMLVMGQRFAVMMMLTGSWDALAKFENGIAQLKEKSDFQATFERTESKEITEDLLPYSVQIVTIDTASVAFKIAEFFDNLDVYIEEMVVDTYETQHATTPMLSIIMTITIPASSHIASIRETFLLFCDDHNLDAIIEPSK